MDGAWAAGLWRLASGGRSAPRVLTEPRLAVCLREAVPDARVLLPPAEGPSRRLLAIDRRRAPVLDLLFLRDALPAAMGGASWIRSFGIRSGVLGCALARAWRRPHVAHLADPVRDSAESERVPAAGHRERQWVRTLEAWIVASSDAVEAPDEDSAVRLREILLPPPGRITVAPVPRGIPMAPSGTDPPGQAPAPGPRGSEGEPLRIGVLASSFSPRANRTLLRALRHSRTFEDSAQGVDLSVELHWLARRQTHAAMRALQDLRRFGLAQSLRWEDEPWSLPPPLRGRCWDVLIQVSPRPGAWPLVRWFRETTGRLVTPATARSVSGADGIRGARGAVEVDWEETCLRDAIRLLAPRPFRMGEAVSGRGPAAVPGALHRER